MQSFSQQSWDKHFLGIFAISSGICTVRILQNQMADPKVIG